MTTTEPTTMATGKVRAGARLTNLARVTWRQHRLALSLTTLAVGGLAGFMLWLSAQIGAQTCGPECRDYRLLEWSNDALRYGGLGLSAVITTFWAAPLLAREFEQRTHLLAWAQDVSPMRWVLTRAALLGAAAVLLATVLCGAAAVLIGQLENRSAWPGGPGGGYFDRWSPTGFELWPPLVVIYTAFGFALGLAVSALTRRTVVAMALAAVGFTAIRVLLTIPRPHYVTGSRFSWPLPTGEPTDDGPPGFPYAGYPQEMGYLNSAGVPVSAPVECESLPGDYNDCLRSRGVASGFYDYLPESTAATAQLIELGIYAVLTVLLLVVVSRRVRRMAVL